MATNTEGEEQRSARSAPGLSPEVPTGGFQQPPDQLNDAMQSFVEFEGLSREEMAAMIKEQKEILKAIEDSKDSKEHAPAREPPLPLHKGASRLQFKDQAQPALAERYLLPDDQVQPRNFKDDPPQLPADAPGNQQKDNGKKKDDDASPDSAIPIAQAIVRQTSSEESGQQDRSESKFSKRQKLKYAVLFILLLLIIITLVAVVIVYSGKANQQEETKLSPTACQPVDCKLSAWSTWSACTPDCDGTKTRTRSVEVEPECGGAACSALKEEVVCSLEPTNCEVSDWSSWSSCSPECDGLQTRSRTVVAEPECGGAACPALEEETACNTEPIDCVVSDWLSWSSCSSSCNGKRTRTRDVKVEPKCGGDSCDSLEDEEDCNVEECCGDSDCDDDEECNGNRCECRFQCCDDNDCSGDWKCNKDNRCEEPCTCKDRDCRGLETCTGCHGTCECQGYQCCYDNDGRCDDGWQGREYCDTDTGQCKTVDPGPGPDECPAGQFISNYPGCCYGECVDCDTDDDCPGSYCDCGPCTCA